MAILSDDDLELLTWAALARGFKVVGRNAHGIHVRMREGGGTKEQFHWNPMCDDAELYRLSAHMMLFTVRRPLFDKHLQRINETTDLGYSASLRSAIICAAAEFAGKDSGFEVE